MSRSGVAASADAQKSTQRLYVRYGTSVELNSSPWLPRQNRKLKTHPIGGRKIPSEFLGSAQSGHTGFISRMESTELFSQAKCSGRGS